MPWFGQEYFEQAEALLQAGRADVIGFARQSLADPVTAAAIAPFKSPAAMADLISSQVLPNMPPSFSTAAAASSDRATVVSAVPPTAASPAVNAPSGVSTNARAEIVALRMTPRPTRITTGMR